MEWSYFAFCSRDQKPLKWGEDLNIIRAESTVRRAAPHILFPLGLIEGTPHTLDYLLNPLICPGRNAKTPACAATEVTLIEFNVNILVLFISGYFNFHLHRTNIKRHCSVVQVVKNSRWNREFSSVSFPLVWSTTFQWVEKAECQSLNQCRCKRTTLHWSAHIA